MIKPGKPTLGQWPQFPVWHARASVLAAGLMCENMTLKTKSRCKMVISVWACRRMAVAGALPWVLCTGVDTWRWFPFQEALLYCKGVCVLGFLYVRSGESAVLLWPFKTIPGLCKGLCPIWSAMGAPVILSVEGRNLSVQRWDWCRLEK